MNQIVRNYSETEKENLNARKEILIVKHAVILIIKLLEMDNIKNISDHFIDWTPGLLRLAIK